MKKIILALTLALPLSVVAQTTITNSSVTTGTVAVGPTTISSTGVHVGSTSFNPTSTPLSVDGAITNTAGSTPVSMFSSVLFNQNTTTGVFGDTAAYLSCVNQVPGTICYAASTYAQDATGTSYPNSYTHTVGFNPQVVQDPLRTLSGDTSNADLYTVASGFTVGPGIWTCCVFRAEGPTGPSTTYGQAATAYDMVDGISPVALYARSGCRLSTCNSAEIKFSGYASGADVQAGGIYGDYQANLKLWSPAAIFVQPVNDALATSSANVNSSNLGFVASYWNGSSSSSAAWTIFHNVNSSGNISNSFLQIQPPSGISGVTEEVNILSPLVATGNVSLGTANLPSSSLSGYGAVDVGVNGNQILSGLDDVNLLVNAYNNGGWKYQVSSYPVTKLEMNNGSYTFDYAAAGTAGGAITWITQATLDTSGNLSVAGGIETGAARKNTFICTAGGTITVANANESATSDVIISLNTPGGTISTAPAMTTVTPGTGFSVLCGASDTSTYNYDILN